MASSPATYEAAVQKLFRGQIPDTQAEALRAIRDYARSNPDFTERALIDASANYFWKTAKQYDPELGINEDPRGTFGSYDHTNKKQVFERLDAADKAFRKVESKNLPSFFRAGFLMTLLMEGLAMKGKQASHNQTSGRYGGIGQIGAEAFFTAWDNAQSLTNKMAGALPKIASPDTPGQAMDHPYKSEALNGARFWQNAMAIHVQMAVVYSHMKPELDRLAKISPALMTDEQKSAFMPMLNTIPVWSQKVLGKLEKGVKLQDITLNDAPDNLKRLMVNNPRVYIDKNYSDPAAIAKKSEKEKIKYRMAHATFKSNMHELIENMLDNVAKDSSRFIRQADIKPTIKPPADIPASKKEAPAAIAATTPDKPAREQPSMLTRAFNKAYRIIASYGASETHPQTAAEPAPKMATENSRIADPSKSDRDLFAQMTTAATNDKSLVIRKSVGPKQPGA